MTTFRYSVRNKPRKPEPFGQITRDIPGENLSGYINGDKASDIEERFYRALSKDDRVQSVEFRMPVISARNLPGQLEIDFVVTVGPTIIPIQIDGEYAHKGESKKADDARKDALVNEFLRPYGAWPVKRIDGELLKDQDMADKIVRELI